MTSRVIIAEDDEDIATLIELVLQDQGIEVHKCTSGVECVQLVAAIDPHLILLDINMPEMDGIEVLKELRATNALDRCAAVVISGEADTERVAEAVRYGAIDFVVKPFDLESLPDRIFRHLPAVAPAKIKKLLEHAKIQDSSLIQKQTAQLLNAYPINHEGEHFYIVMPAGLTPTVIARFPDSETMNAFFVFQRVGTTWQLVWPVLPDESSKVAS